MNWARLIKLDYPCGKKWTLTPILYTKLISDGFNSLIKCGMLKCNILKCEK